MQEHRLSYSIQRMARLFEVSLSGYYKPFNYYPYIWQQTYFDKFNKKK